MSHFILHTISSYDVFGPEKTTINECRALLKKGCETAIIVIWPEGGSPFLEKLRKAKVPYYHLESNSKFDIGAIKKLMSILSETKADLVHSHGYKSDIISLIACRLSKVPVVTTVHGWTSEDRKVRIYEKMQAFSWRFFDRVICVSQFYKQMAIKAGVPENNITVIHNGIITDGDILRDADSRRKDFLGQYDIPDDHFTVGIIGRLSIEKGHKYFLEAASRILKKLPKVSFLIVGDGPEKANIAKSIENLDLGKNVRMVGHVDDMRSVYSSLDSVAITSLREGLPNVLLESILYEKPVVATEVGGIPEVISNGKDGLLVPSGDSLAISIAVADLIQKPELRRSFTVSAKKKLLDNFTFENRMKRIEELYSEETAGSHR